MSTKTKPVAADHSAKSGESGRFADAKQMAAEKLQMCGSHYVAEPARDLGSQLVDYARRKPDVAAMWCFGLGLIVGWKLRS